LLGEAEVVGESDLCLVELELIDWVTEGEGEGEEEEGEGLDDKEEVGLADREVERVVDVDTEGESLMKQGRQPGWPYST